jgi:hypothetical protein
MIQGVMAAEHDVAPGIVEQPGESIIPALPFCNRKKVRERAILQIRDPGDRVR